MKIAVHILAYNVNRFLGETLKNVEPYVDKIYVAHAEKPFGYMPDVRENNRNPTTLFDIHSALDSKKVEVIEGDWLTEESMRNDCLRKARSEGFDWFIIQDADELYTDANWEMILKSLSKNFSDDHIVTTWYNFWKSSQYVLVDSNGSIKGTNAGFAIRCKSSVQFINKRLCNANNSKIIDYPCYHYGYVMNDKEMLEKLSTWSHSAEVNSKFWYFHKWLSWSENTRYLHPTFPPTWTKAIRFPLHQPSFAEDFSLDIPKINHMNIANLLNDLYYDIKVNLMISNRSVKKIIKSLRT